VSRDDDLPLFMTRRELAAHVSATRFPVSPRTIERWPVRGKFLNGHRVVDTNHALEHADAMIAEAPTVATGRSGLRRRAPRIVRTG
jgi:hypothetical protein